jgi:starch phosphorylase
MKDTYMHLVDYPAYIIRQEEVDQAYRNREAWTRMSILNAARCGYFSSDRAVQQYCAEIWNTKPVKSSK